MHPWTQVRLSPKRPIEREDTPVRIPGLLVQAVRENLPEEAKGALLWEPVGCSRCQGGYRGRFALIETMPLDDEIRRAVVEGASALTIREVALKQGMVTLRRVGLLNALRGKTSLEEVLRVTQGE